MAIDTRDKRASCIGIDGPYRFVLPNPDGAAEDSGDRKQMAYKYRGGDAPPAATRGHLIESSLFNSILVS